MKRRKFKKVHQEINSIAHIASDFLRVGMWKIINKKSKTNIAVKKQVFHYGSGKGSGVVIVRGGGLTCEDRDIWYLIEAMDERNKRQGVKGHITELVREFLKIKGVYIYNDKAYINQVWDSIETLLDQHVRIRPNQRGGSLSTGFTFLEGEIATDGTYDLKIGYYRDLVEKHKLFEVTMPLEEHFAIKSGIGRNLKDFIKYHNNLYSKRGYFISVTPLCKHIGYDITGKEKWQVIRNIKHAIEELIKLSIIDCYNYNPDRCKDKYGLLTFWKEKQEQKTTKKLNNDEFLNIIMEYFPDVEDSKGLHSALNSMRRHLEDKYSITKPGHTMEKYLDWFSDKITYFDVQMFYPGNKFYVQFAKQHLHSDELRWKDEQAKWSFIEDGKLWFMDEYGKFYNNDGQLWTG